MVIATKTGVHHNADLSLTVDSQPEANVFFQQIGAQTFMEQKGVQMEV